MKIETSRYTLQIIEDRSTYHKMDHIEAIEGINHAKAAPKVDGRVPKSIRSAITSRRRILKSDYPRIYRIQVYFKKYKCKRVFDMEFVAGKNAKFATVLQKKVNEELGNYRRGTLQPNSGKRSILQEYTAEIAGNAYTNWVYSKPGQMRTIYLKRKVKDLYTTKAPEKSCHYIGVELEFCAPIEELEFALKLWNAGIHKYGQIKKDGSLRPKPNEQGFELALLFPESHYRKHLKTVCKVLAEVGARADERRCGLHVHLDMRKRRKKDIVYNNLVACQNMLSSFLDPSRRDNEFCRSVESRKFPTKFENNREERYKTINAASYYKYKTLEVRMHEGSVNFIDIANWMSLLIKISNHKTRIKKDINELTALRKRVRIDDKMSEFFQDKACFWQLQGPQRRSSPSASPALRMFDLDEAPSTVVSVVRS